MGLYTWLMKIAIALGFKKGFDEGFDEGVVEGAEKGKASAQQLVKWLHEYGSFEDIPTRFLLTLNDQGYMANCQRLKVAYLKLRKIVDDLDLPEIEDLGEIVADYLENNDAISDYEISQIQDIVLSKHSFAMLLEYAFELGDIDKDELYDALDKNAVIKQSFQEYMHARSFEVL